MESEKLKKYLLSESTRLYCVLDGASVPDLPMRLYQTNTPHYCLLGDDVKPDVLYSAPFLAALLPGSSFMEQVFKESPGKHWGIYAHCRRSMTEVRRHCRALLRVFDEDGNPLMFRYYDPRVLRKFLPTCNAGELKTLFGELDTLFAESTDGKTIASYRLDNNELKETELD
jgi:hypothetical protein